MMPQLLHCDSWMCPLDFVAPIAYRDLQNTKEEIEREPLEMIVHSKRYKSHLHSVNESQYPTSNYQLTKLTLLLYYMMTLLKHEVLQLKTP